MSGGGPVEEVCLIAVRRAGRGNDFLMKHATKDGPAFVQVSDPTGASVTLSQMDYLVLRVLFEDVDGVPRR